MSLTVCEVLLPSAKFNGESTLPSLYEMSNVQYLAESRLDEDDELFVGYSIYPDRTTSPGHYVLLVEGTKEHTEEDEEETRQ